MFAPRDALRALGIVVFSALFADSGSKVEISLTHPASDVQVLRLITPEHGMRLRVQPTSYEYWPSDHDKHPWIHESTDGWGLPWVNLTRSEGFTRLSEDEWQDRDLVIGFGGIHGTIRMGQLLLDAGRDNDARDEYEMEGEIGFRGVPRAAANSGSGCPGPSLGTAGSLTSLSYDRIIRSCRGLCARGRAANAAEPIRTCSVGCGGPLVPVRVDHTKRAFILAVVAKKGRARDVARGRGTAEIWIDHAVIEPSDLDWLAPVRKLTLWAVDSPEGFLATLPNLEWLDVRGGSGASADFVIGCDGLRYLQINQVRGLSNVSAVGDLVTLELLSLHGLPKVTVLPSLAPLRALARLELGSLKGLASIAPALDAPALAELLLIRAVSMDADDPRRIRDAPQIKAFGWFAEDVPDRVWEPVVRVIDKPAVRALSPSDWFASRE